MSRTTSVASTNALQQQFPGISEFVLFSEYGSSFKSLREIIEEPSLIDEKIDWRMCVKIAIDVARGLDFFQKNNIAHRDVKLNTVFACRDTDWHAKFSCNQFLKPGAKPNDPTIDILEFGLFMAELLIGEKLQQIISSKTDNGNACSLSETKLRKLIPFDCPEGFEALICECCRDESNRRPPLRTCLEELAEVLEDLPTTSDFSLLPKVTTSLETKEGLSDEEVVTLGKKEKAEVAGRSSQSLSSLIARFNLLENEVTGLRKENKVLTERLNGLLAQPSAGATENTVSTNTSVNKILDLLDTRVSSIESELLEKTLVETVASDMFANLNGNQKQQESSQPQHWIDHLKNIISSIQNQLNVLESRVGTNTESLSAHSESIAELSKSVSTHRAEQLDQNSLRSTRADDEIRLMTKVESAMQEHVSAFVSVVDQALAVQSQLASTIRSNVIGMINDGQQFSSPVNPSGALLSREPPASVVFTPGAESGGVPAAGNDLSHALNSFLDVIQKCSGFTTKTHDMIQKLDQNMSNLHNPVSDPPSLQTQLQLEALRAKEEFQLPNDLKVSMRGKSSRSSSPRITSRSPSRSGSPTGKSSSSSGFTFSLTPRDTIHKSFSLPQQESADGRPRSSSPRHEASKSITGNAKVMNGAPQPLPNGFWKREQGWGTKYKEAGWVLRPDSDAAQRTSKSIGTPGTPHLLQADSKLLPQFYRADRADIAKDRNREIKAGVYRPGEKYRSIKTGSFFESCNDPEPTLQPGNGSGKKSAPTSLINLLNGSSS